MSKSEIEINISLWDKLGKISILFLCLYAIYFAIWTVLFTETGNGDNVEHIHATWLVAYGKMPYRDFFQHHNPLLWYVFAPFIRFSSNLVFLLDAAHAISLFTGFLTLCVVYKICVRFFSDCRAAAFLSLLVLCPPYFYIVCFNYNPDTFMALFYAIGLYALFGFWDKPRIFTLSISFTAFFVAFLFTQKILMVLAILGALSLFVFYQKKTPVTDLFFALLPAILGLLLFIAFLYKNDALNLYWVSNYPFNVKMQDYYGYRKIDVMDWQRLIFAAVLSGTSILCFIKNANVYFRVTSILFVIELILRCFYFSIAPYYMLPLMIYMVCLNTKLIATALKKSIWFMYLALAVAGYYAYVSEPAYLSKRGQDRGFTTYLLQNITPCDYLVSAFFANQSIITKDPHYYWSMLGHIDVLGEDMGIRPKPNLTNLVIDYKPVFIYGGDYLNSYYWHRNQDIILQNINPNVIATYYEPTPFFNFYILKNEYRGKNCRYNAAKKEWLYAN